MAEDGQAEWGPKLGWGTPGTDQFPFYWYDEANTLVYDPLPGLELSEASLRSMTAAGHSWATPQSLRR